MSPKTDLSNAFSSAAGHPSVGMIPENLNEDDDDYSQSECEGEDSRSTPSTQPESVERDEVKEIKNYSKKETAQVRRWRGIATLALLGTACAVTLVTYRFLAEEQEDNFRQAVRQMSLSPSQT